MDALTAMELALDAMHSCTKHFVDNDISWNSEVDEAINALRDAIKIAEKCEPAVELHVSENGAITGTGGKAVNLQRGWNKLFINPFPDALAEINSLKARLDSCDELLREEFARRQDAITFLSPEQRVEYQKHITAIMRASLDKMTFQEGPIIVLDSSLSPQTQEAPKDPQHP